LKVYRAKSKIMKLLLKRRILFFKQWRVHWQKPLKELQDKCLDFGNRCVQRLKQVFNSVGASSEKFEPLVEDLPGTFEHIEGEVYALDEVIAGHGDFYALLASRGTAVAFMKTGCTHGKIINRPNFSLSPADLTDIPAWPEA
jgi:hypothetical protein